MKIVYQISNGYFASKVNCQKSPLEKDVYLIPLGTIEEAPPPFNENEIPFWNGSSWEIRPDFSNKKYYHKETKEEKYFEKGQPFDSSFTFIAPIENENFQKWDEHLNSWIIDEDAKNENNIKIENYKIFKKQKRIRKLLLESDYTELPSFLERKGKETYDLWMSYRADLRLAYHDTDLPIPDPPQ